MAKKRKAAAQAEVSADPIELDPRESRKKIRTYEDVADSDDEFHLNQDEIRLGEGPEVKRKRRQAEQEEFLQQSDEEVVGYSEAEASDFDGDDADTSHANIAQSDSDDEAIGGAAEDEDEVGWGASKADLYGEDEIDTEERALEQEAEAIRLQKKQLQAMQTADYGFDEDEWQRDAFKHDNQSSDKRGVVTEVLPQLQIAPDLSFLERLKLLKARYPEFDPLSKELVRLQGIHARLLGAAETSPVARTKLRAASAYIGALVMYFSLFTSTAAQGKPEATAMSAVQLRDHPVMDSLVKAREFWNEVGPLSETPSQSSDALIMKEKTSYVSDPLEVEESAVRTVIAPRKSRAQRFAEATEAAEQQRRAERLKRTEAGLADLDALIAPSKPLKSTSRRVQQEDDDSDLGEEAPLTAREAADKAQKKKSLRFYTSQIAQKANKRGTAGRNAGGDDDIPYRERLKDRQARLNAEATNRGKRDDDGGADLDGQSDEEDHRQAKQIREEADEDDYYDLVAARASKKKLDRANLAAAQKQAALEGGRVVPEEVVGTDGKRKISYLIEKNKGLTPHRKKDVRNPRVKKKKKYEEKKKKLASIKPVYKGGEGRGGYGGELTGIKKGLVKSTKL
ncbi:hypothetical protein CLAFUW4_01212 [Fulvia fulva]|uniref:Sas10 C-terminal domain-containing protein n=1 Tax=Passalora fulva TaxID=5499 RepID=A0A9Q8L5V4_PASFU|nr:uncharacterized protein CLAFUR5_01217 [Fulvia fulva]KAK4635338.1 hypothetical protein CLAFUR4_01213 [Fulvia fulva]KAK4637432.1 hypothetical protein CLAFUR0_01214 [Fulvia fulva]UJO11407.1 hypothetical protein CLAFUR5_01217 [Fulvia fulva]WPV08098.1 hypothetical protein CLAFUW4_01212 [Fulvia fulva]WPV24703.1 hypothetical protein CLAFUW7_01217 [Fulvia fulva]